MKLRPALLSIVCVFVCGAMFFAGLRPRGYRFRNDVSWIGTGNGVRFGRIGIAFTPKLLTPSEWPGESISIEIALRFHQQSFRRFSTILCLWDEGNPVSFSLSQWNMILVVRRTREVFGGNVFADLESRIEPGREYLVTITSKKGAGTTLYLDGRRSGFTPDFSLVDAGTLGRLVVGNSPTARQSWRGEVYALAISGELFTGEMVLERSRKWRETRTLPLMPSSMAVYAFDERRGETVRDRSGRFSDLRLPALLHMPKKEILPMPWKDLRLNRSFLNDVVINILGFIPFGFIFRALMGSLGVFFRRRTLLLTLLAGGAISLVFELGQVFIPTRASQMSDFLLNVLGTWAGALAAGLIWPSSRIKAGKFSKSVES